MSKALLLKAVKEKCLDCCCGQLSEVKLCPSIDCTLHKYRLGKDPDSKRELSPEQREMYVNRMKNIHKNSENN